MPEILTKYPQIVKKLLEAIGAICGQGIPKILTKCPTNNFCRVPDGELCVLGLEDVDKLTQFTSQEIFQQGGKNECWQTFLLIVVIVLILWIIYFLYTSYLNYIEYQENRKNRKDLFINMQLMDILNIK